MDNNGKILEILVQIQGDISDLKQGQAKLETGQAETNQRLDKLEQGQSKLEQGQYKLEAETARIRQSVANIEVEHGRKLGLLIDGHTLITDKLDPLPEAVETLQEDVSVIKLAVMDHSNAIKAVKSAV